MLDKAGKVQTVGNYIAVVNEKATSFYMVDKIADANYILSIPDELVSNVVNMMNGMLFVGRKGMYVLSQGRYEMIFRFDYDNTNAVIKSVDGKDFVVYTYSSGQMGDVQLRFGPSATPLYFGNPEQELNIYGLTDNYKLYRVNRNLDVSEIECDDELSSYSLIESNSSAVDNIVVMNNATRVVKVLSFDSELSDPSIESHPISMEDQRRSTFHITHLEFYTLGYGNIVVTVGDNVAYDYNNASSPLVVNDNNDNRLKKTTLSLASEIAMDYKEVTVNYSSTLSLDNVKAVGTFLKDQ